LVTPQRGFGAWDRLGELSASGSHFPNRPLKGIERAASWYQESRTFLLNFPGRSVGVRQQ
jgi:hypothetical protein